jgi:hypothetical protein
MTTIDVDQVLEQHTCCVCGVLFAAPLRLMRERRDHGGNFYCPNGHVLTFKQSQVERLRQLLEQTEQHARSLRESLDAARRSKAAIQGANTKLRQRIEAGRG